MTRTGWCKRHHYAYESVGPVGCPQCYREEKQMTGIEVPKEQCGATFAFKAGVITQTNLDHPLEEVLQAIADADEETAVLQFNTVDEDGAPEGVIIIDPEELVFMKVGRRHQFQKRVQPVPGLLKQ